MRSLLTVGFALLLAFASSAVVASADCRLHAGDHVVLYSNTEDPDVLAWDSRFRLRDYNAASFDVAKQLEPHALLLAPGTRAIVVACFTNFVQSRMLDSADDAVGIIIVSGPDRGKGRWVLGSDVRGVYHAIRH